MVLVRAKEKRMSVVFSYVSTVRNILRLYLALVITKLLCVKNIQKEVLVWSTLQSDKQHARLVKLKEWSVVWKILLLGSCWERKRCVHLPRPWLCSFAKLKVLLSMGYKYIFKNKDRFPSRLMFASYEY